MKQTANPRRWILGALIAIGILAVLAFFSEDEIPTRQWILTRLAYAAIAAGCYYGFRRLRSRWGTTDNY